MSPIELYHNIQRNEPDRSGIETLSNLLYEPYFHRSSDIVLTQISYHHLVDTDIFNTELIKQ